MNSVIEIHDSRVVDITENDGIVVVHFKPAYIHKSEGRPAMDAGTGWVQEARLIFSEGTIHGDFRDWPCDLMGGEMIINSAQHNNLIPVPLELSGHVDVRFVCNDVDVVKIVGSAVRLELVGEPRYVEEFKPYGSVV